MPKIKVNVLGLVVGLAVYSFYILLFRVFPQYSPQLKSEFFENNLHMNLNITTSVSGILSPYESCLQFAKNNDIPQIDNQYDISGHSRPVKLRWIFLGCSNHLDSQKEIPKVEEKFDSIFKEKIIEALPQVDKRIGLPSLENNSAATGVLAQSTPYTLSKEIITNAVDKILDVSEEKKLKKFIKNLPTDTKSCLKVKKKYSVHPGSSWGTLPVPLQKQWSSMKCDALLDEIDKEHKDVIAKWNDKFDAGDRDKIQGRQIPSSEESNVSKAANEAKSTANRIEESSNVESILEDKANGKKKNSLNAGLLNIKDEVKEWCIEAKEKYEVQPMKSWGRLPMNMVQMWTNRRCDMVFTNMRMGQRPLSSCINIQSDLSTVTTIRSEKSEGLFGSIGNLLRGNRGGDTNNTVSSSHPNMQIFLPLISILAGTTTRRVQNPSTSSMALFTYLLPSLIRSLDCGYRYEYVLGYDKGDPFYDSDKGMKSVKQWFSINVETPMREQAIVFTLRTVRVHNNIKKPGPVFIEMARQAYTGGADYFYRVNDDTEVTANWPHMFVTALHSLSAPFGVVGPLCQQGNQNILTHDFVSRTHMEVFDMNYYPPELTDWWMDDWISWVYGQKRTFRALQHPVIHHTGAHGQRYEVDRSHEKLLKQLVIDGRAKIRTWMLKHNVDKESLRIFDGDNANIGFKISDIPKRLYP